MGFFYSLTVVELMDSCDEPKARSSAPQAHGRRHNRNKDLNPRIFEGFVFLRGTVCQTVPNLCLAKNPRRSTDLLGGFVCFFNWKSVHKICIWWFVYRAWNVFCPGTGHVVSWFFCCGPCDMIFLFFQSEIRYSKSEMFPLPPAGPDAAFGRAWRRAHSAETGKETASPHVFISHVFTSHVFISHPGSEIIQIILFQSRDER